MIHGLTDSQYSTPAATRGRKRVVLLGQPKALALAVKREGAGQRLTRLAERVAGEKEGG